MKRRPHRETLKKLGIAMAACFAAGLALKPFISVIHKAWTLTFTCYHTGFVLLGLVLFYFVFDVKAYRKPAFPLLVVGANSIFIYTLLSLFRGWVDQSLGAFTGRFAFLGPVAPGVQACAVAVVLWYPCYWAYRRKIFFKL
jgi:heparan-alpha-glucosaminide N-acetyltransferase